MISIEFNIPFYFIFTSINFYIFRHHPLLGGLAAESLQPQQHPHLHQLTHPGGPLLQTVQCVQNPPRLHHGRL